MEDLDKVNQQFTEFLHTKGIKAKFKVAFDNMKENTRVQHEKDKAEFNAVKQKSYEENKAFVDMLHTKGFKAKIKVILEGFKASAEEAKLQKQQEGEELKQREDTSIAELTDEFNAYLQAKGLNYTVKIEEK